jgi:hypothetical protein
MIKSRRMRWARHIAHKGKKGICIGFSWQSRKERVQQEDQNVKGSKKKVELFP